MKCSAVVLGVILLAATASAQTNFNGRQLPAAPSLDADTAQPAVLLADAAPDSAASSASSAAFPAIGDPGAQGVPVYQVRPAYSWQLYTGYTFFRFYEVPTVTNTGNGFDVTMNYFPHAGWIGAEGGLMATFGSQAGCISKFVLATGGLRLRFAGPQGIQFFVHGVAGGSHFFPQTAFGSQNAFGYEAGGGVDISRHRRRTALRFEVDAVGTRFFGTYQYSPKATAGIVFNF